jgi:probable O-glycosylation ligase (exosortase A-associated)
MRDIILIGFISACLIAALRYPYVGLLTWAWFSLMTPHQLAYGVYGIPLNMIIAGVTIFSYVLSAEITKFRFDALTTLIMLFAGWLTLSQTFSLDAQNSAIYFDRFIKTLLFVVLTIQMTTSKLRFNALVWTFVAGIGFFAAKGALFTIATFGQYRVQGLPQTVLEDNNHFGIAAATILPLILYLRTQSAKPWLRAALLVLFGCTVIAVIGTQSRGAFVSLVVFGGYFWARSQRKLSILAGLMLLVIPTIAFMPAKWTERMTTISDAANDASFMGRVDAWIINYKLAKENPLTGAGLRNSYQFDIAQSVDPERAKRAKAAHSIYFEILGGSGFVGLIIYLSIFVVAFFSAWRIYLSRNGPELAPWKWNFAYYAQISLAVFAVGGASTSMEMWDGYLIVIALIAALAKMTPETVHKRRYSLEVSPRHDGRRQRRLKSLLDKPVA